MDESEDTGMDAGPSSRTDDALLAPALPPATPPDLAPLARDPSPPRAPPAPHYVPTGRPLAPRHRLPKSHAARFNSIELPAALTHAWTDAPYRGGPMGLAPVPGPPELNDYPPPELAGLDPLSGPPRITPARALQHLGGQAAVDAVFNHASRMIECKLALGERWAHPLAGEAVDCQRVVLRIVRRRRRRRAQDADGDQVMRDASLAHGPTAPFSPASTAPTTPRPVLDAHGDEMDIKPPRPLRTDLLDAGVFKVEMMGVVQRTVRFRAMADYQYIPDRDALIPALMEKLMMADPQAMLDFRLPALDEEYFVPIDGAEAGEAAPDAADGAGADTAAEARPSRSSAIDPALGPAGSPGQGDSLPAPSEAAPSPTVIDLSSETPPEPAERIWADNDIRFRSRINVLPSPLFSRQAIWPNVGYAPNPMSRAQTVVDPITGETTTRLHNIARNKGGAMTSLRFGEMEIPQGPTEDMITTKPQLDQRVIERFLELLEQRPVWSRLAIMCQFDRNDQKVLDSKKTYFPLCAWTYIDGPYRDMIMRFGYDPRTDPDSYLYQRVYFRSFKEGSGIRETARRDFDVDFAGGGRGSKGKDSELARRRAEELGVQIDINKGYIFDGRILHRDVANYQLIDITDPLLAGLIRNEKARREKLTFDSGWFHKSKFEAIKNILRRKWLALSDGRELAEADLETELEEYHAEIDSDDKDTQPPKKPTGGAAPGRRKPGRPKGGGGYAAGHIPAGQTMRQLAPSERWKRKGVALIPFNEEQLQARRLQRAIEREERQARHATMRVAVDEEEDGAESDLSD